MNKAVQEQVPDGHGLADAGLVRWVSEVRRSVAPSCRDAGVQRLRAAARARTAGRPRGPELPLVQDLRTDHGLAVRLYRPSQGLRPTVLYLHGGGFVIGDLESHDGTCRRLAQIADVTVLAVDYRLAPEHPGPAAVEDAVSAFVWARQQLQELGGDPETGVALAGDSSGGALAVLAAVRLHADEMTPTALLLAYPNADMTLRGDSVTQEGHGWGLEADDLRWFVEQWLPEGGVGGGGDVNLGAGFGLPLPAEAHGGQSETQTQSTPSFSPVKDFVNGMRNWATSLAASRMGY